MKKNLKIEYEGIVLFDGEVDEVSWNDGPNGITVTGRNRKAGTTSSSLIDLLSAASRRPKSNAGEAAKEVVQQQEPAPTEDAAP